MLTAALYLTVDNGKFGEVGVDSERVEELADLLLLQRPHVVQAHVLPLFSSTDLFPNSVSL